MRIKAALLVVVIALAAVLAACGSEATSADLAEDPGGATVALRPLFDSEGFVLREKTTDLPIYAVSRAVGLHPAFHADGSLRRCPVTDSPLYRHGEGATAVLVRVAR